MNTFIWIRSLFSIKPTYLGKDYSYIAEHAATESLLDLCIFPERKGGRLL